MDRSRWVEWGVVAAIVGAFVVIPAIIIWQPPQLPFRVAFLILPLVPAVVLAFIALWFALRQRDQRDADGL